MSSSLISKAHMLLLGICAAYAGFFLAMLSPFFQKHFVFLHKIQFPLLANFQNPERYGMAPFKVRDLRLTTPDKIQIGAWHVLPEAFYQKEMAKRDGNGLMPEGPLSDSDFDRALKEYPTIIYLHGNAANRAAPLRIRTYSHLTARLPVNVVAIDYRGFGDSHGDPTEDGLVSDARAAWNYVLEKSGQTDGKNIIIFGQSLGTGVASKLTRQLHQDGIPPRSVVLMAPYTSLRTLVKDYRIGGILPILAPIQLIPFHDRLLNRFLRTHFETSSALPALLSTSEPGRQHPNIIILHADNDGVIPVAHGQRLFSSLVKTRGEASKTWSPSQVRSRRLRGFGTVSHFELQGPAPGKDGNARATFINTHHGGHDHLGEGAVDEIGKACDLFKSS